MTSLVEHHVEGSVGWISLNNPRKKNALRYETYAGLNNALDDLESNDDIRAIVLKGNGGNFSSGFDVTQGAPDPHRDFIRDVSGPVVKRLWYGPKPTIAMIEGYCVGGGFELAMGADLIYAADNAQLGEPEVDFFFTPDYNPIPCIVLPRKAKEMIMLGQIISGLEAAQIGLINRALPAEDLLGEIRKVGDRLAALPADTVAMAKVGLNGALDAQGFTSAISFSEEIAISNAAANKTNPDCQAFYQAIREQGFQAAMRMVRKSRPLAHQPQRTAPDPEKD